MAAIAPNCLPRPRRGWHARPVRRPSDEFPSGEPQTAATPPRRALTAADFALFAVVVLIWGLSWICVRFQVGVVAPEISGLWRFARPRRRQPGARSDPPPARSPPRGASFRARALDGWARRAGRTGRRGRSRARSRRRRSRRPHRRPRRPRAFPREGPPSRRARSRAPPPSSRSDCRPAPADAGARGERAPGQPPGLAGRIYAGCCPRRTLGALRK